MDLLTPRTDPASAPSRTPLFQLLAIGLCLLLGLAMIANNEMGGEAMWFWYATVFHHGAHLYSDLHVALQPLFVLITDAWMTVFGRRLLVTQLPPVLEIGVMGLGLFLVLRESRWPDWQKAIILFGSFCFIVCGHSYRFDDYHVLTENFILYALLLLLILARTSVLRSQLLLVSALGLVAGLTITTRLTDGAALLAATLLCLPFLLRRHRLASLALFFGIAAVTVIVVILLTGDTLAAYASNSIFHAAGSKGGTGSIFAAPFRVVVNVIPVFLRAGKRPFVGLLFLLVVGIAIARLRPRAARFIFPIQLVLAAILFLISGEERQYLIWGYAIATIVLVLIPVLYALTAWVLVRFLVPTLRANSDTTFDRRELLILLVLAEWASYSAGAAAEPLTNYYAPLALLLLLVPILQPLRRQAAWFDPSFLTLMVLLAASTLSSKYVTPYSWQNYVISPMFQHRVIYQHPVYGTMYIDRDLLDFSQRVCTDIGAHPGVNHPRMLSLPYPFPNYFCDTPPWHNYVQTFFDTSTRATIEKLMRELQADPPEWIVYQRQMNIMRGAERLYNHGQPLAQRDLDTLIANKLHSGDWVLVDQSDYLGSVEGSGWFIIHTRR